MTTEMFDNYDNVPAGYIPDNRPKTVTPVIDIKVVVNPGQPKEVKDAWNNIVGYEWFYGDKVTLSFKVEQEVIGGTPIFPVGKALYFDIFDHRLEQITRKILSIPQTTTVSFDIDGELTEKMVPGNYYCRMVLIDNNDNQVTLFDTDTYMLFVKGENEDE